MLIYIEDKSFSVDAPYGTLSGATIMLIGKIPTNYQLYIQEIDNSIRAVSLSEAVDLRGEPKRFFAVPPGIMAG